MSMQLQIENVLQKIDTYFESKTKKDTNIIYVMIVLVAFAIAYPLYDFSFDKFQLEKSRVDELSAKIDIDKAYLSVNTQDSLNRLLLDIQKTNKDYQDTKSANAYIKDKISSISSLIYNQVAWGEYLDSISKNAQKYNIKIIDFKNKYVQSDESFGHVLDINLDVSAPYANMLEFIASLEKSDLVVDLHDFNISAKDRLDSNLNISVWGITYQ